MTEGRAWLVQARSDYMCIGRIYEPEDFSTRCQAIAKCQQSVEKSVKALVVSLRDHKIMSIEPGWTHAVERFMNALISLPRSGRNRDLQARIHGLFDAIVRGNIRALDQLAPRRPPPGHDPALNTEYPFKKDGEWHAPAEELAFMDADVLRFRSLAHRILSGCDRLIATIELMT